jgi:hypothetical protein
VLICGNAGIREDLGASPPKLRVAAKTGLESNLFSQVPRRFAASRLRGCAHGAGVEERPFKGRAKRLDSMWALAPEGLAEKSVSSAGGEDEGYFALAAGDAGSNPVTGTCARVAKR